MTQTNNGITIEARLAVNDLLVHEAALLDWNRYEEWLELFTDDVEYNAPVRVTRKSGNPSIVEEMHWFDENKTSLGLRVRRLGTDVAWAEDPPSMTRRFITNLRISQQDSPAGAEFEVVSNLMLFRSRGDGGQFDLIAGERTDRIRPVDGALKISRRRTILDQASLGTKNLGVFL